MKKAELGDVVKVHYLAKTKDEIIFDTKKPFQLTIGKKEVIPAFETALIGMSIGESKTVNVPSDKAFGPYFKELISKIEKEKIPENLKLEIGKQLKIQQPDDTAILVTIIDMDDKTITFDANHPLAGKDIIFSIELLEILQK